MKRAHMFLVSLLGLIGSNVSAVPITTSAQGTDANGTYAYLFSIEQDATNDHLFHASLTNTSSYSGPLIDLLAFNMLDPDPVLSTDFSIVNITPTWIFNQISGGGVEFDYTGERDAPTDRLAQNESLLFDFLFNAAFSLPSDPYSLWTDSEIACGSGIGGGEDCGQVAVSFQEIATIEGSDLLASNWDAASVGVPEPGALGAMGLGILTLWMFRTPRRRDAEPS